MANTPSKNGAAAEVERPCVLVVDDDPAIRDLFTDSLSRFYRVASAADVREAEALLRTTPIQVIVSDYHLAAEDALPFLKKVKKYFPNIRSILITGDVNTSMVMAALNEGRIFYFLPKPVDMELLHITVEDALRERKMLEDYERIIQSRREPQSGLPGDDSTLFRIRRLFTGVTGIVAASFLFLGSLGVIILLLLYLLKSLLGIDVFSDTHLMDILFGKEP